MSRWSRPPRASPRHNQTRQVTITGDTISGDSTAITRAINEILDQYTLPQGYTAQTAGAYEDMMDSFGDLGLALARGPAAGLLRAGRAV